MTTKCAENRPKDHKGEKEVVKKEFKLDDINDEPITLTVYAGCIEGDRVTYSTNGKDRLVLAFGTVLEVIRYTVGDEITLKGANVPKEYKGEKFQRNINRKQADAIQRIKDEMEGTGEVKKDGQFNGFTITVNGEKITPESILNSYFKEITFVEKDGTPIVKPVAEVGKDDKLFLKDGKPVKMMGGVELIASAIITPGAEYFRANRDYSMEK